MEELYKCATCKKDKIKIEFYKRTDRKNGKGVQSSCIECLKQYNKIRGNTLARKESNKKFDIKRTKIFFDIIIKYKSVPCKDCNISYPPYMMDFDHINSSEKICNISQMRELYYSNKLIQEIEKCEVVCSNCHRIRTHKRTKLLNCNYVYRDYS